MRTKLVRVTSGPSIDAAQPAARAIVKLTEVLHPNFADCSPLGAVLAGQDAAVFCLGAYTGVVSDAEMRTITVDYTVEFARVLRASSPDAAFSFLSGSGADPTGQSRIAFARFKGEAERALSVAGFSRLYIFGRRTFTPSSLGRNRTPATDRDIRAMVASVK